MEWASLVAQPVKGLPAMQETQVRFLGWEDPLEQEMAIHSSILAWRILCTEEPGRLQFVGSQGSGMTESCAHTYTHTHTHTHVEFRKMTNEPICRAGIEMQA